MKKFIMTILLLCLFLFFLYKYFFSYTEKNTFTNQDFYIDDYTSMVDMDQDGVDDQTDILESVREYISKKPKYKSKYYKGGYPTDNYGVCTDVVAFGLKGAGYDLMELVNQDILSNRSKYSIDKVDKNIDFRRVRNLKVYFENTATILTTDVHDLDEWQGGDIVVFKNHIGIVSDKRNKDGVSYVIHHANVFQKNYEENILEKRHDIVGHYRIS